MSVVFAKARAMAVGFRKESANMGVPVVNDDDKDIRTQLAIGSERC